MPQLAYTKVKSGDWGKPGTPRAYGDAIPAPRTEGFLERPDGHKIYYHEYGNPKGVPLIMLHGGPGGSTYPYYSKFFDPEYYRIILFDQRGCGKSTPNVKDDLKAALTNNTTQNLIGDIDALREHLHLGSIHLAGGSWGTTLALAYAEKHPEHVRSLLLRSIFTCTKRDLDYFYQGNAEHYDPGHPGDHTEKEGAYRAYLDNGKQPFMIPADKRDPRMGEAYAKAWHDYVSIIPKEKRGDMVKAYHDIFWDDTVPHEKKLEAAVAWSVWEGITSNLSQDTSPEAMARFSDPDFAIAFAAIENHYFYNGVFLNGHDRDQRELLKPKNIAQIAHLPIYITHGKYDQVCPVFQAHDLVHALEGAGAENLHYRETECGHSLLEADHLKNMVDFADTVRNDERTKNGGKNPVTDKLNLSANAQRGI